MHTRRMIRQIMLKAHRRLRASVVAGSALATVAGGALDAWVYLAHGHVFATAQTGNVVLMAAAFISGDDRGAASHLLSVMAFIAGLLISRFSGEALKRAGLNSRSIRLGVECVLLIVLGVTADRWPDHVIITAVGFIAGVQITSLSHIGAWSFNTGMTTGNLRSTASAFAKAAMGSKEEWPHALAMSLLCIAFAVGALAGGLMTPRLGGLTLLPVAALIAAAVVALPQQLDPIPDWKDL